MKFSKLLEDLLGLSRPMGLLELQNRGFKNTMETEPDSRIQVYKRGVYTAMYDTKEEEVVSLERRD